MNIYPILHTNTKKKNQNIFLLAKLEKAVFEKRPALGRNFDRDNLLSLKEFTKKQFDIPGNDAITEVKKKELIETIKKETTRLLDKEVADRIEKQLLRNYQVITTDHHGPLTDAGFLNGNLLVHSITEDSENVKDIIMLSCANISFDNPSFPRGHLFHTMGENGPVLNQLGFFSRKVRPLTVSGNPAFTLENLENVKTKILAMIREQLLKQEYADKLIAIIDEIYADPSVHSVKTFSEQVTKTNFALWKKIVGNNSSNLIYLEQEQIVNQLIHDYHLTNNTLINRIIFDESLFEKFVRHFDGINSGFSLKKRTGTYLFWAFPKDQKYRVQLWKEGNKLISADRSYSVELTPAAIGKAIQDKELLPSTLLSFIILSFYYGLSLMGGRRQTSYLTKMKAAYENFILDIGELENLQLLHLVSTMKQSLPFPGVAFLQDKNRNKIPATTFDILLYGDSNYLDTIKHMAQSATVEQIVLRALPDLYRSAVPEAEQDEQLKSISHEAIDLVTQFDSLIKPIGTLL